MFRNFVTNLVRGEKFGLHQHVSDYSQSGDVLGLQKHKLFKIIFHYVCRVYGYHINISTTHDDMRETGDKISKRFNHLVAILSRFEILARFTVTFLYSLDSKAQRGCWRNCLSPNHVSEDRNRFDDDNAFKSIPFIYFILILLVTP